VSSSGRDVVIRRLPPDDWRLFREIRLRALTEAPAAFSATLAEATRLDEPAWRARLATRAQFIALLGVKPVGTAGGIRTGSGAELISMWVDPTARGAGIGDRLVQAVLDWAHNQGADAVELWVASGNEAAERLYARNGFRRTGDSQPMAEDRPDRCEFAMRCSLGAAERSQRR